MKNIFIFDSAVQHLGFMNIIYNDTYTLDCKSFIKKTKEIISSIRKNKTNKDEHTKLLEVSILLLDEIDIFLLSIIRINYCDIYDLVPGKKVSDVPYVEISSRLKSLLWYIDNFLEKPDIVLLEDQMRINQNSEPISHQIMYHYSVSSQCYFQQKMLKSKPNAFYTTKDNISIITYATLNNFNTMQNCNAALSTQGNTAQDNTALSTQGNTAQDNTAQIFQSNIVIQLVNPKSKNKYHLCEQGMYKHFKGLNDGEKKHTEFNLNYFLAITTGINSLGEIKNKMYDISDCFMLFYAWLKDNNML